jgi:transcriptional regulator with XRE-family HTH domain
MRLGIAQGMVAEPDYRDYLIDQIEERFGSRYRFCKETKIPQAFLSQVLSGKKDFSVEMLRRAAQALGLGLALLPKADFAEPAEFSALRKTAALVASDLTRVTDIRENLTRYKSPRRQLDAFARERSIVGDPVVDEITRALEQIPEEKRAEEILRLLEEKQRKLEPLLKLLREKIASLADEPKMLSKGEHRGSPSLLRV